MSGSIYSGQPDRVISNDESQFACAQFYQLLWSDILGPMERWSHLSELQRTCYKIQLRQGNNALKAILQGWNTPTEGIDGPKTDVTASIVSPGLGHALLQPQVIIDVVGKLQHRKEVSELIYDMTTKTCLSWLWETQFRLNHDHTHLQRVMPWSHLVQVQSSSYHCKPVDPHVAEPVPSQNPVVGSKTPPLKYSGLQPQSDDWRWEGTFSMLCPKPTPSRLDSSLHASGPPQTLDVPTVSPSPHSPAPSQYGHQI